MSSHTFLQRRGMNTRTGIRKIFYLCHRRDIHRESRRCHGERRGVEDASVLLLVRSIMATRSGKWLSLHFTRRKLLVSSEKRLRHCDTLLFPRSSSIEFQRLFQTLAIH